MHLLRRRLPHALLVAGSLAALMAPTASASPMNEAEPNDDATTKQVLLGGQQWTGAIQTGNDMDAWKLYVGAGSHQVQLRISLPPEPYSRLIHFSIAQPFSRYVLLENLASQFVGTGDTQTLAYTLRGPGTYYLQAVLYSAFSGTPLVYTVDVVGAGLLSAPSCAKEKSTTTRAQHAVTRARKAYHRRGTASHRRALSKAKERLGTAKQRLAICRRG